MGKKQKRDVDLVIISDVHLGTYGCHADELLRYLKTIKPKKIILNGDIIDMWQFSKRYWPKSHMQVVKYITSLLTKNTKIVYLTGNHDEMLRKFSGFRLGSFVIDNKVVVKLQGKRAWVFHGDVFDVTMKYSKWLAKLGAIGYDTLIVINTLVNWVLNRFGREKISLSKRVKDSVKSAVKFINNFEQTAADIAIENKYDYVVCGHIHHPEIKKIVTEKGEVIYLNSGDWVENLTALEYHGGEWSIYRYAQDKKAQSIKLPKRLRSNLDNDEIFRDLVNEFLTVKEVKLLYAIQGTGNGHLARAEDIIPLLKQYGDLDLFVSGAQADIKLSHPVKYNSKGLSFFFGKNGGIDFLRTFKRNSSREVYKEIKKFPVEKYDLVINDFEPISAWSCHKKEIPCVGLSHQAALLSPKVPRPKDFDPVGEWVLKNYAPVKSYVAFHFSRFDNFIYTPVIRSVIRNAAQVKEQEHYTVYLPAYDDKKLVPLLAKIPYVRWHIFSKHTRKPYHVGKLSVYPVNSDDFAASMTAAKGVLCGAGFETPAEALYLNKKLMVVPMKAQHEQHYNAAALKSMGVPVLKKVKKRSIDKIAEWIDSDVRVTVDYPDVTAEAVERAIQLGRQ